MFRELKRAKQQLPPKECIRLLKSETRGVLSVNGDDGFPYGMPMNHYYNDHDGCIYFHCGKSGHRLDSIKRSDKVSYCVYDRGEREAGDWAYNVKSVIAFGKICVIEDLETIVDITTLLSKRFTNDIEYIKNEIENYSHQTLLLRLVPEHICGKSVKEA